MSVVVFGALPRRADDAQHGRRAGVGTGAVGPAVAAVLRRILDIDRHCDRYRTLVVWIQIQHIGCDN